MNEKNIWLVLLILAASLFGGCNNAPSSADVSTASQNTSTASQNTSGSLNCQQFIEALTKKNPTPTNGRLIVKQEQNRCYVKPEKSADINAVKSALFYQQWSGPGIEKIGRGVDNVRLQSDFVTIYFELL